MASVGPTLTAQAVPFSGSISYAISTLPTIAFAGGGDGVSNAAVASLGVGATLTGSTVVPVTSMTPGGFVTFPAFPIVQLTLSGPAGITAGTFVAGGGPGGGFGGDTPNAGVAKLGLFGPPPFAFLTLPLSAAGVQGASAMVSSPLGITITLFGGGWTTGPVQVVGTTGPFAGVTLASATGSDARTPAGAGTLTLVSPSLVRTNIAGFDNLPIIHVLTVTYETTTTTTTAPPTTTTTTTVPDAKVTICHKELTLSVSVNALPAHLAHGDTFGACPP